jgi:Peptidase A4 family
MYHKAVFVPLAFLVLATLSLSTSLDAQTAAHGRWVFDPAGIATPGFVYDLPPAEFNPLTASDAELEQWGFPPRPSTEDAAAYGRWEKIATAKRVTPKLTFTNIYHGPAQNVKIGPPIKNATSTTSSNWSGYVVAGANGLFTPNNSDVFSVWIVPAAHQASSPPTCTSTWVYSSQWVGFDGWGSGDVLQAGTEADANCSSTSYYFWYEWYPFAETRISLPVGPGDVAQVTVTYKTTSPHGQAVILNLTTGQSSVISFNPPSGTNYVGNSAEWIMERPTINGSLPDLSNYVYDLFTTSESGNGHTTYLPSGPVPPGGAIYNVSMTCPPWNPSSACTTTTTISEVGLVDGFNTLVFNGEVGPAY